MALSTPHDDSTSYVAFALIDGLFDLLLEKGTITVDEFNGLRAAAAIKLDSVSNSTARRGARFLVEEAKRSERLE
jgi:hypothetical protein